MNLSTPTAAPGAWVMVDDVDDSHPFHMTIGSDTDGAFFERYEQGRGTALRVMRRCPQLPPGVYPVTVNGHPAGNLRVG